MRNIRVCQKQQLWSFNWLSKDRNIEPQKKFFHGNKTNQRHLPSLVCFQPPKTCIPSGIMEPTQRECLEPNHKTLTPFSQRRFPKLREAYKNISVRCLPQDWDGMDLLKVHIIPQWTQVTYASSSKILSRSAELMDTSARHREETAAALFLSDSLRMPERSQPCVYLSEAH